MSGWHRPPQATGGGVNSGIGIGMAVPGYHALVAPPHAFLVPAGARWRRLVMDRINCGFKA